MSKNVKLYALSTCGWCKRTVDWLDENQVECDKVYVDKLTGADREQILEEMKTFNPGRTFPTIVIDSGRTVIIGFKPDDLARELGK